MNAIAGGGTFVTLPTLIFTGLDARVANATSTVALWPGSLAGAYGYLPELKAQTRRWPLFVISLVGPTIGELWIRLVSGRAIPMSPGTASGQSRDQGGRGRQ